MEQYKQKLCKFCAEFWNFFTEKGASTITKAVRGYFGVWSTPTYMVQSKGAFISQIIIATNLLQIQVLQILIPVEQEWIVNQVLKDVNTLTTQIPKVPKKLKFKITNDIYQSLLIHIQSVYSILLYTKFTFTLSTLNCKLNFKNKQKALKIVFLCCLLLDNLFENAIKN